MKTDTLNRERKKKNTYKRKLFYVFYVTLLEFECDAVVKNPKKRPKTCHTFIIGDK